MKQGILLPSGATWRLLTLLAVSLFVTTCGAATPPPFYCRRNEIQCPSKIKTCIPVLGLCNGVKDCPDGSDESPTLCKAYKCNITDVRFEWTGEVHNYFRTSKCPSGNMCTKEPIIEWRPDEEDAGNFFLCTGGPKQCADGSDEDPKYCKNLNCEETDLGNLAITCPSKKFCLAPLCDFCGRDSDRLCDGVKECPDGSDEWPSFCKTNGCSYYADRDFRCKDKGCVRTEQICNGVRDCADGSDENSTFCASYTCPYSAGKKCAGGRICLPSGSLCDGKRDCPDGSDEKAAFCKTYKCEAPFFKCKDGVQCAGKRNTRISNTSPLCNNVYDCKDKSDESNANCKNVTCSPDYVKCPGEGGCIYYSEFCNGKPNCLGGTDEKVEVCKKYKCPSYTIQCRKDFSCVEGRFCDGIVDCKDKSDEDSAFCKAYKCPAGTVKCPKFPYQCISSTLLCDGKKQCINGGDEDPVSCKKP